ncbi:MAG: hypothetical protein HGA19_22500 [Oscillochloris sp.]|nr:hypothetical protein [Oscillochloris sp.]
MRPNLLLPHRFGIALNQNIRDELGIGGMAQPIPPFSGSDARGDGLPASRVQPDARHLAQRGADPLVGHAHDLSLDYRQGFHAPSGALP